MTPAVGRSVSMSTRAFAGSGRQQARSEYRILETVLRRQTDLFEVRRSVLAVAPQPALDETLAGLGHLRYVRAEHAGEPALSLAEETFDIAIADARLDDSSAPPLAELARMLRPGGRLILSVAARQALFCARRLAATGFFVTHAHESPELCVLLAVRGEFMARS